MRPLGRNWRVTARGVRRWSRQLRLFRPSQIWHSLGHSRLIDRDGATCEKLASTELECSETQIYFGTADAKPGSVLTKVAPNAFLMAGKATKHAALRDGKLARGRQVARLLDWFQYFKITEADGAVCEIV